jgi:hypothetical protein
MFDLDKYTSTTPIQVLLEKYYEVAGKVFGLYFARNRATDEDKKSLEALDFMEGLMSGNIKKEWNLKDDKDYKLMCELVKAINLLGSDK